MSKIISMYFCYKSVGVNSVNRMISARVTVCHFQLQLKNGSDFTLTLSPHVFLQLAHLPSQQACTQGKLFHYAAKYRGQRCFSQCFLASPGRSYVVTHPPKEKQKEENAKATSRRPFQFSHPPEAGDVGTVDVILTLQMTVKTEGGDLSLVTSLCSLLELPTQMRDVA